MNAADERRLLRLMAQHGIGEFSYANAGETALLSLAGLMPLHPEIRARQAGRFLSSHPALPQQIDYPRQVREGEIVAYLKVGALLVPVVAAEDATLLGPLKGDGEIAGYGDLLF